MAERVLITRDPERAAELIELLNAEGIEAIAEPMTRPVFEVAAENIRLDDFDWIAFTSVNGVRGFARWLTQRAMSLPAHVKLAAVGAGTAKSVEEHFRAADLVSDGSGGSQFAGDLLRSGKSFARPPRVLWPCAHRPRPEFADALRKAEITIQPFKVYRTETYPIDELEEKLERHWPWDVVVFAAPSAVDAFFSAWSGTCCFACIAAGETTAKELRLTGCERVVASDGPDACSLRDAIVQTIHERAF